jgi:hypothetical protein
MPETEPRRRVKEQETGAPRDPEEAMTNNNHVVVKSVKAGISFGSCLAMIISYTAWQSIFWAIVHGICSWGYVVYYIIRY